MKSKLRRSDSTHWYTGSRCWLRRAKKLFGFLIAWKRSPSATNVQTTTDTIAVRIHKRLRAAVTRIRPHAGQKRESAGPREREQYGQPGDAWDEGKAGLFSGGAIDVKSRLTAGRGKVSVRVRRRAVWRFLPLPSHRLQSNVLRLSCWQALETMLRYFTAGESHGETLVAFLSG